MQFRNVLVSILIATSAVPLALAVDDLTVGIALFNKGNFQQAATYLVRAVRNREAKNPIAHYYLAGTLAHLNQLANALTEYQYCYILDPKGQTGPLCLKAIDLYEPKVAAEKAGKESAAKPPAAAPVPAPAPTQVAPPKPVEIDAKFRALNLPKIQPVETETPDANTFLDWSKYDQAIYLSTAVGRKDRATEALEQMEELVKRVEPMLSSCVPNHPDYGEPEPQFLQRQQKGKAQLDALLGPYKAELEKRKKTLAEAELIVGTSTAAKAELKIK